MDIENSTIADNINSTKIRHANRHVPKFLEIPESHVLRINDNEEENEEGCTRQAMTSSSQSSSHPIQLVRDGRRVTAQRLLLNNVDDLTLTRPILIHDTAHSIGMKVLQYNTKRQNRPVTVRDVADLLGHDYPVHVIDVEVQEELDDWTLADLVEYFEGEERIFLHRQQQERFAAASASAARHGDDNNNNNIIGPTTTTNEPSSTIQPPRRQQRQRRKAAQKCLFQQDRVQRPRVINQISLEFSKTPMIDYFLSPQFVRDLDWIDNAWPRKIKNDGDTDTIVNGKMVSRYSNNLDDVYPNVQYYCLTSEAGCYTDFHIDFGGTAVWYHVLSGEKEFCLIPPTPENLTAYEDWLCSPDQSEVFFPTLISSAEDSNTKNVFRISLKAGQTFIIPSAWIHAVYTPSDSLVVGGNFLTGLDISLQLQVHKIEARSRVKDNYRLPYFLPLNFYAGGYYLSKLRRGDIAPREVDGLGDLITALDHWWKSRGLPEITARDTINNTNKSREAITTTPTLPTIVTAGIESAEKNGCATVEEFLTEFRNEYDRVIRCIKAGDGITSNPNFPLATTPIFLPTTSTIPSTNSLASASKVKLRLSLKSRNKPPPPRPPDDHEKKDTVPFVSSSSIAPKMTASSHTEGITKSKKINFRIVAPNVSSTSPPPPPIESAIPEMGTRTKRRAKRPSEDAEWIDDGLTMDDEWVPEDRSRGRRRSATSKSPTSQRRGSKTSSSSGLNTKEVATSSNNDIIPKRQKSSRKEAEPTTSRQRLMKRLW
jgi:hypothetical protein